MRATALLVTSLTLLAPAACSREDHEARHDTGLQSRQGLPTPAPLEPEHDAKPAAPEPAPEPPAEPADPEVDQELGERKVALANVGKAAFEALKTGEFARLRELTPLDEGPVREACPGAPRVDPVELEAKFDYCHREIDWASVGEARVFAGKPTGEPALGCEPGIEDYGRLQLYLHMQDGKTIWRVDFHGAVGVDGKALGIAGSLSCKQVDEAPPL